MAKDEDLQSGGGRRARRIGRKEFGRRLLRGGAAVGAALGGAGAWLGGGRARAAQGAETGPYPDACDHEALIVGSGFGGAVMAARLSRQFPGEVLLVERGRRYPRGSFPREAAELTAAIRRDPADGTPRPLPLPGKSNGLLDLRSYEGMDILVANGYGGGSLIYGAAIIEPSHPRFDERWPASVKRDQLAPYFEVFRQVLDARPVPTGGGDRALPRLDYYEHVARRSGKRSTRVPVGVFFGNDPERPAPRGEEQVNRHGATQTSCVYCAECVLGCNYHAKSSVDLNYLYAAEQYYGMQVQTETAVDRVVPLAADGSEDPGADGRYGFRVTLVDVASGAQRSVTSKRVVLSAGTLGTTELLLRNKLRHGTLPRISRRLGQRFSGNGDFLGLVLGGFKRDGNAYGPTVTQTIDYNDPERPERSYVLEDMALPHLTHVAEWLVGLTDGGSPWGRLWRRVKDVLDGPSDGKNSGFATQVFVGLDASDGEMRLGEDGALRLRWSYWASRRLYGALVDRIRATKWSVLGLAWFHMPTYAWPWRRSFTVHPLGGCALADAPSEGVVSADRRSFGQVFGYTNLFVADGSMIPSALGANPSLTIGALAEMVAEGITGQPPTVDL